MAKIYGEQKAIRVNRAVDMKKLQVLQNSKKSLSFSDVCPFRYRLENMIKFTEAAKKRAKAKEEAARAASPSKDGVEKKQSKKTSPKPDQDPESDEKTSDSEKPPEPAVRRRRVGGAAKPEGEC